MEDKDFQGSQPRELGAACDREGMGGSPSSSLGADVFELYGCLMVAEGRMTETRFRRAMDAQREVRR